MVSADVRLPGAVADVDVDVVGAGVGTWVGVASSADERAGGARRLGSDWEGRERASGSFPLFLSHSLSL